jgi:acetyltransferase-like isoleucine patch superfamily enzyme
MKSLLMYKDYVYPEFESDLDVNINLGRGYILRMGTILYPNITIGDKFVTGNNAIIRSNTTIGNNVLVGTNVVIEGECIIGNNVKLQTGVYVTLYTTIEDDVFMGPYSVTTNDKNMDYGNGDKLIGPTIKKGARIGAGAVILPGIIIGKNATVGAGTIVTKNVPPNATVINNPSRILKWN